MDLYEYQAKDLFAAHGVPVFPGSVATTPDEARAFFADNTSDKKSRLIEALLLRPEYADFWANIWGDLLRNKREGDEQKRGTFAFAAWIRNCFAQNMPYDKFVG